MKSFTSNPFSNPFAKKRHGIPSTSPTPTQPVSFPTNRAFHVLPSDPDSFTAIPLAESSKWK